MGSLGAPEIEKTKINHWMGLMGALGAPEIEIPITCLSMGALGC